MEEFVCKNCGSSEYEIKDGYKICKFCKSKFKVNLLKDIDTKIELNEDVLKLLNKIKLDPTNKAKYINLILDIDPTNREILKYV